MRGTTSKKYTQEHFTPLWISLAQLVFAAILLYAIRNPAPLHQLEASLERSTKPEATITVNIPVSNVAVAATGNDILNKQPM